MAYTPAALDEAVVVWLESHKAFTKYLVDTEDLFNVFASGWRDSPRALAEAFTAFCEAMLDAPIVSSDDFA